MAPKKDPRRQPIPTPAPAEFLGAKKKPLSAAAAAKSAGGPPPARPSKSAPSSTVTSGAAESGKRQRNSSGLSGSTGAEPKKPKEAYDPLAMAQPLGAARNPPPSPASSVSTVRSEVTDGGPGPILDHEVGDELQQIKDCISGMDVNALPYAGQVGLYP